MCCLCCILYFPFLMWMCLMLFTSTMFSFHVWNKSLIAQNSYLYALSIDFRYSQKPIQLKLMLDSSLLDSHVNGLFCISYILLDESILSVTRLLPCLYQKFPWNSTWLIYLFWLHFPMCTCLVSTKNNNLKFISYSCI